MPRKAVGTKTKTAKTPARKRTGGARPSKAAAKKATQTRGTALLSKTTARAKWIGGVEEHEERPGQTLATRSHEVIRLWAEERRAVPATVESTRHDGRAGVLRFDFPGFGGGKRLQQISWEDWFRTFDERELIFLYQEHLKNGNESNFFRLDNPRREEG